MTALIVELIALCAAGGVTAIYPTNTTATLVLWALLAYSAVGVFRQVRLALIPRRSNTISVPKIPGLKRLQSTPPAWHTVLVAITIALLAICNWESIPPKWVAYYVVVFLLFRSFSFILFFVSCMVLRLVYEKQDGLGPESLDKLLEADGDNTGWSFVPSLSMVFSSPKTVGVLIAGVFLELLLLIPLVIIPALFVHQLAGV